MSVLDLGIPDVHALPELDLESWKRVSETMCGISAGLVPVAPPQVVSGQLLDRSVAVVTHANRFFVELTDAYYRRPDLRDEFLVNPLLDPLLELEADLQAATPLSRLDTVPTEGGGIRIIEINSVGPRMRTRETLMHLTRELDRTGLADVARQLDQLTRDMIHHGFLRFIHRQKPVQSRRLVIGALAPTGYFGDNQLLFRAAFAQAGIEYVFGGPEHLEVTDREVRIRGTGIDVLWADAFFYFAYQYADFKHRALRPRGASPARMPDLDRVVAQVAELIADARFLSHLRSGNVVNISPARAYLALPKSLLSWVHRPDRPIDAGVRAFLAQHVAHTYAARERLDGVVTLDQVVRDRGDFVLKPSRSNASHGVIIGRDADAAAWRHQVTVCWNDPAWALQDFHEPIKNIDGQWVYLGLPNLDGTLGGFFFRTSSSLLLDAGGATFAAGVLEHRP